MNEGFWNYRFALVEGDHSEMAGMQGAFTRFEHFGKRWDERGGLNGCGVVGTEVRESLHPKRQETAVAIERERHVHQSIARVVVAQKRLRAGGEPAHGPAQLTRGNKDRQVFGMAGGRQELREVDPAIASLGRLVSVDDVVDARPGLLSVGRTDHPGWSSWIRASSRVRKPCRTRSTVRFERRTFSVISATS